MGRTTKVTFGLRSNSQFSKSGSVISRDAWRHERSEMAGCHRNSAGFSAYAPRLIFAQRSASMDAHQ